MNKKNLLFPVLFLMVNVCSASDWTRIADIQNGAIRMNFESIAQVGAYRKAWVRTDHFVPEETVDGQKKKYRSVKSLYYFDCAAKTKAVVQSVGYEDYDGAGNVVFSEGTKFSPNQLNDVIPDTIGEQLLNAVCTTPAGRSKLRAKDQAREKEAQRYFDSISTKVPDSTSLDNK